MLSAPIVITAATTEVIALATVKTFLRVDGAALDLEIEGYISGVVADIEKMTGTRLAPQVVEIRADRFADLEHLQIGPVTTVESVRYRDSAGAEQTVAQDAYELVATELEAGIFPTFSARWPTPAPGAPVRVQMDVGYAAIPADLRLTLLLAIEAKFNGTACDLFSMTVNSRIWA